MNRISSEYTVRKGVISFQIFLWTLIAGCFCISLAFADTNSTREERGITQTPGVTTVVAQATRGQSYNISPGPLSSALNQFADQNGLTLVYNSALVEGLRTRGISGKFSREEGLQQLLRGTGVKFLITKNNTLEMEKMAAADKELTPIQVQGQFEAAESAYGPVDGLVAKKSATGSKTDTPLIETPRSISVISAETMNARNVTNLGQSLSYTSGVVGEALGIEVVDQNHIIRGFFVTDGGYRDGLSYSPASFVDPSPDHYGTERVEVLRGPGSTLYGQGNPGGLVNTVTKRPTEKFFGEIEALAGSYNKYQGRFDFGGPIDDDKKFLYRLTGSHYDGDTLVDFLDDRRTFIAPALTWRPTDNTTITFLTHYQKEDSSPITQLLLPVGTVLPNPNGKIPSSFFTGEPGFDKYDNEVFSFSSIIEHKVSDMWTLRQNLRYEYGIADFKTLYLDSYRPDLVNVSRSVYNAENEVKGFTVDNNAQAKFNMGFTKHTALFGIDYKLVLSDDVSGFGGSVSDINVFNPVYGNQVTAAATTFDANENRRQIGVYLQDQIKLFDKWVVTLGGRHDWARTESDDNLTATTTLQKDTAFTGQAGLAYLFDNGLAPYFSFAESFEPTSGTDFSGNLFEPTTGTQYEAGIKFQPPDTNALLTLSVFELTRQNVLTDDPNNLFFSVQTGEIRSRGVEAEAVAEVFDNFNVTAAASFTDVEVTDSNGTDLGKRPTSIPEITASVWGDYKFTEGDLDGLGVGGGVRYIGSTFGDPDNTLEVPAYTLFDAVVRYDVKKGTYKGMGLAVNVTNLLDKEFISACAFSSCYYGSRRVITGSVKFRW